MSRTLRLVLQVDAAAMPAVLLGAVPPMMTFDRHAGSIGMLILAYLVVLGVLGAAMATLTGLAMSRGEPDLPGSTWFFTR